MIALSQGMYINTTIKPGNRAVLSEDEINKPEAEAGQDRVRLRLVATACAWFLGNLQ